MAHGVIILRYTRTRIIRNCSWTHSRRNRELYRTVALLARQLQLRARREKQTNVLQRLRILIPATSGGFWRFGETAN